MVQNYYVGLPSIPPVTTATPLSNTSFTVNWTISDPNYSYTVILTNINTGVHVVDSFTVAENTNSYTVTGLSDNDNYNVSVAIVGVCGMITSDPITVYGKSMHTNSKCVYNYVCTLISILLLYMKVLPTLYVVYIYTHTYVRICVVSTTYICMVLMFQNAHIASMYY